MPNPLVVDAWPLILLAKAGWLKLLSIAGDPVHVPEPVVKEIQQAVPGDPMVQALAATSWLITVDPGPVHGSLRSVRLGAGEQAVLTWALLNPGTEAVIDDPAARRCALKLGIPHFGCLGLVIHARQQGVIPAARPVLAHLRRVGLRLSDRLMDATLAQIGE